MCRTILNGNSVPRVISHPIIFGVSMNLLVVMTKKRGYLKDEYGKGYIDFFYIRKPKNLPPILKPYNN